MNRFFDINEAGQRALPFPLHPKSPLEKLPSLRSGSSRLTIPNTYSTITCQRRFAPTAVHLRSGTPFGFPPDQRSPSPEYPSTMMTDAHVGYDN